MSFLKKELFDTLVACEEFSEIANATDAQVKPLVFMSMDGGDQMKQLRINRSWPLCQYTLYDMEAIFIFVHVSGSSEYNIIERQMASVITVNCRGHFAIRHVWIPPEFPKPNS